MTFIFWVFGKVGFCEMFAKRGTLQRSGREVLRELILKKIITLISLQNVPLSEIYFSRLLFQICSLGPGSL